MIGSGFTLSDLADVNFRYERMYQGHERLHRELIASLDAQANSSVLEIACGTGFTIPHFKAKGLKYYGWDISETALSVAMLKYPEELFVNMGVTDLELVRDDSFDIVYNSSMLEHIGFYEHALREMVRVAKNEAYIMFFDGLSDEDDNASEFHPYTEDEISGRSKGVFGRKVTIQDHLAHDEKGWYLNRFSRKVISSLAAGLGHEFRILDRSNTAYIDDEAVLVVRKTQAP